MPLAASCRSSGAASGAPSKPTPAAVMAFVIASLILAPPPAGQSPPAAQPRRARPKSPHPPVPPSAASLRNGGLTPRGVDHRCGPPDPPLGVCPSPRPPWRHRPRYSLQSRGAPHRILLKPASRSALQCTQPRAPPDGAAGSERGVSSSVILTCCLSLLLPSRAAAGMPRARCPALPARRPLLDGACPALPGRGGWKPAAGEWPAPPLALCCDLRLRPPCPPPLHHCTTEVAPTRRLPGASCDEQVRLTRRAVRVSSRGRSHRPAGARGLSRPRFRSGWFAWRVRRRRCSAPRRPQRPWDTWRGRTCPRR